MRQRFKLFKLFERFKLFELWQRRKFIVLSFVILSVVRNSKRSFASLRMTIWIMLVFDLYISSMRVQSLLRVRRLAGVAAEEVHRSDHGEFYL